VLLVAAGFAPAWHETGFAAPELVRLRTALDYTLAHVLAAVDLDNQARVGKCVNTVAPGGGMGCRPRSNWTIGEGGLININMGQGGGRRGGGLDAALVPQAAAGRPRREKMTRDFIGYGAEPPHAGWPGDARIAVNFVINFEEGSELSYPAGDGVSEGMLTEMIGADLGLRGRDLAAESMFEYGARVGFWRLHRIFTRFRLPVTIFGCARAFAANPAAAAAIAASDWDICSHGYRWTNHPGLPEDEERRQIGAAVALIKETTGKSPLGWYCRYAPSENTRRLLVEHGGFLYDSDTYNDELPYWVRVNDRPHLVIPYSLTTNDSKFGRGVFGSGEDFFAFLRDSFDLLYEEGADRPRLMSVGLHMRLTGHPGRATALIRFIEYLRTHERVWICRREDIARHWIGRFPPPG
jgi:allantoinase